jgi:hypothetical protein
VVFFLNFLLEEQLQTAVPSIRIWNNAEKLQINERILNTEEYSLITNVEYISSQSRFVKEAIEQWEEIFYTSGEVMTGGILRPSYIFIKHPEPKSINGISSEFSKIKNINELIEFAFTYGNLGLSLQQRERDIFQQLSAYSTEYKLTCWNAFENVVPGFNYFEPFELWWYHIDKVRKILKLYRALSRQNRGVDTEIEDNVLRIGEQVSHKKCPTHNINWFDGTPTSIEVPEDNLDDFVQIGRLVLKKTIEKYAFKGIELRESQIVETKKNDLGFYVLGKRTTQYLITAIYYELWQLISTNLVVEICQNPKCKLPYIKSKRQQYCSDACKQEAYRIRKATMEK